MNRASTTSNGSKLQAMSVYVSDIHGRSLSGHWHTKMGSAYATEETANVYGIFHHIRVHSVAVVGGSRCHMLKHFSICSLYESESLNTGKYKPRQHLSCKRKASRCQSGFQPCRHSRIRLGKKKLNFISFTYVIEKYLSLWQKDLPTTKDLVPS